MNLFSVSNYFCKNIANIYLCYFLKVYSFSSEQTFFFNEFITKSKFMNKRINYKKRNIQTRLTYFPKYKK